jgi:hypothetical protein
MLLWPPGKAPSEAKAIVAATGMRGQTAAEVVEAALAR